MTDTSDVKQSGALTRADLREAVYQQLSHLSRSQITRLVDEVFEEICIAFEAGDTVKLRGFGTFKVRSKKERIGRNPKNGVEAVITQRRVISFYPSNSLVAFMNNQEHTTKDDME